MSDHVLAAYGHEEGAFYYHHVRRTEPFERVKHYHSTYELYYLISGKRTYFIKDRSYRIEGGDLVLIDKYDVHKSTVLGEAAHERVVINFNDDFLGAGAPLHPERLVAQFRGEVNVLRLREPEQRFVLELLGKLGREASQRSPGYETYMRLLLLELLLFSSRQRGREEAAEPAPAGAAHAKIADIVRHINGCYRDNLTLSSIAASFFMSPSYLSRTFKTVTGFTLTGYVHLTRVKEAQRLLRDTDDKISDIAAAVGFEHIGHFERIFKTVAQSTPQAFRKAYRQSG